MCLYIGGTLVFAGGCPHSSSLILFRNKLCIYNQGHTSCICWVAVKVVPLDKIIVFAWE